MIQRPQSIFLLIVVIANSFVLAGENIWTKRGISGQWAQVNATHWTISQNDQVISNQAHYGLTALFFISILLTLFILFSYKSRMRQMGLGLVNTLFIAGSMGYSFWIIFKHANPAFEPDYQGQYSQSFYAMVIALLANMIANRLIRKDEMLVQSSNRMR